jgi:ABC-type transporter MlaC component
MLSRRSVIALIQATGVVVTAPRLTRRAWAQPGEQAVTFVKNTAQQLVAIVDSEDSSQEKRHRLRQVIDATVDVNDIAHFVWADSGASLRPSSGSSTSACSATCW